MWLTMIEPINGSEDNVKNFHGGSQKPPPPSVAVAHKLDGISGAQSASDLSLLFNGGKKLFRYFQYFFSRFTLCVSFNSNLELVANQVLLPAFK